MKKNILFIAIAALISASSCAQISYDKLKKEAEKAKKQAEKVLNGESPLTNEEIIKGLKEALTIGSKNSSSLASKADAYYKNTRLFIPFPPEALKVEKKLRELGLGNKVDEFVVTLNRAAEKAAKDAAPIFTDAVKKMTIKDGLKILNGANNEATMYLKTNTNTALNAQFKPVISKALESVSATKYWGDLINTYNKIPTVTKMNPDLAAYTTGKAIDGLFILVADEELKIRTNPAARVTEILQKVFGRKK